MSEQHKIKVLWIDDEPQDGFRKYAYNQKGIYLDVAKSVDEGLEMLQNRDKIYEAIILDANCVIRPGDVPVLDALTYAIVNLYRLRIDIPWFVYTAGGERWKEILPYLIPKDILWLKRQYYDKPADQEAILDDIREAVSQFQATQIKQKYPEVFEVYEGMDLINLLIDMHNNDAFSRDCTVPNRVRQIMDFICDYMSKIGIVPFDFEPSKITEHSRFIGKKEMNEIIPLHIQRLMFFLVDYSNNGSHRFLQVTELIRSGKAPYVNITAVYALLNILQWLSSLPDLDSDAMDLIAVKAAMIYSK